MGKVFKIIVTIICIVMGFSALMFGKSIISKKSGNKKTKDKKESINIKENYNTYVTVNSDTNIYDSKNKKIGEIKKDSKIILDTEDKIKDKYYKLQDVDIYIKYDKVTKSDVFVYENEYKTYKNYIIYNESLKTKDKYNLSNNNGINYEIDKSDTYNVIIKDDDKYGIELNNQLYYISKDDVESTNEANNTESSVASSIAVLNYHYTIDENSDEGKECRQTICMSQTQVEEEIKYLSDNSFYPATMQDLYLFLTGKIRLPEKSVAITIDDGWYLARMIGILEKYKMLGTLYLIGSLASPNDYRSEYLEIHSHTWDMHTPNVCSGSHHGGGLLCLDNQTILDDLKKSRESLNNTEVLCYPFYEYNTRTIELVKKAGFKMALAGGYKKAKPGDNIYAVPRFELGNYTTINEFINMVN